MGDVTQESSAASGRFLSLSLARGQTKYTLVRLNFREARGMGERRLA